MMRMYRKFCQSQGRTADSFCLAKLGSKIMSSEGIVMTISVPVVIHATVM